MKILGWKAWSEYSVFDSRDVRPIQLPWSVQFVVVFRESGSREFLTGAKSDDFKWYIFLPNFRVVADEGKLPVVESRWGNQGVLVRGTWTSDENYARIVKEAREAVW